MSINISSSVSGNASNIDTPVIVTKSQELLNESASQSSSIDNATHHHILSEIPTLKPKEIADENGKTELFLAVEKGDFNKVKSLLKQGLSPNTLAKDGTSMLAIALKYFDTGIIESEKVNHTSKQYALIELLLANGANPKLGFNEKLSAFDVALIKTNFTLLKMLLPYWDPKYRFCKKTLSTFFMFCSAKDIKSILALYPTILEIPEDNYTAVHHCAREKNQQLLEFLAKEHPEFFKRAIQLRSIAKNDENAETPLEMALFGVVPSLNIVTFLAEHGGVLERLSLEPFWLNSEIFDWAIADKRIFFIKDSEGYTLLHQLLLEPNRSRRKHFINKLIEAGADIRVKNNVGQTAVDLAVLCENSEAISFMQKSKFASDLPKPKWQEAIQPGQIGLLKNLTLTPEDITSLMKPDVFGFSVMQRAIQNHNLEAVKFLKSCSEYHVDTAACLKFAAQNGSAEIFAAFYNDFCKNAESFTKSKLKDLFKEAAAYENREVINWFLKTFPADSSFWDRIPVSSIIATENKDLYERKVRHAPDFEKFEAFEQAVKNRKRERASFLIEHLEKSSYYSTNIFHYLMALGDADLLRKAIELFPFVSHHMDKNAEGHDPFDIALKHKRYDLIDILWPHAWTEMKHANYFFQEFIQKTFDIGNIHLVKALLADSSAKAKMRELKICPKEYTISSTCNLLAYAAFLDNQELVALLVEQGFPLAGEVVFSEIPTDTALFFALQSENKDMLQTIVDAYQSQHLTPDLHSLFNDLVFSSLRRKMNSDRIIAAAIQCSLQFLRPDIGASYANDLSQALTRVCREKNLIIILLEYFVSSYDSIEEMRSSIQNLDEFFKALPDVCKVNYGDLSLEHTVFWVEKQLFMHIFLGMNPKLAQDPVVFPKILEALKLVQKPEDYGFLFVALQTAPTIELAFQAFKAAKEKDLNGIVLSKKWLLAKTMSIEEQKKWLAYTSVYRDRNGLSICYEIVRNFQSHKELLPYALQAIERIAVEPKERTQDLLLRVIDQAEKKEHKLMALKALMAIYEKIPKEIIFKLLAQARENGHQELEIALIQALSRCESENPAQTEEIVHFLIGYLEHASADVRVEIIHTLSILPNEEGLLKALALVKGPDWDPYKKGFGKNSVDVLGSFLTFRSRPDLIHDNRAAMVERITNSLVQLNMSNPQFKEKLESQFSTYQKDPSSNLNINQLKTAITNGMKSHIRYCKVPFFYPQGTDLIRGLSTRKGDAGFLESIRDLIRKGCGSASLTDNEADITGGTWKKIGHIFASHCKDLFFGEDEGCTYFSANKDGVVSDSALVIFPASFYQSEYLKGQARIERENTYNNVLYRGIPKVKIGSLYLPERFEQDLLLVSGQEPIADVKAKLTSDLFTGFSVKKLMEFRRHLQAEGFYKKIRFFKEGNAKAVEKQLMKDGCRFASEGQVIDETLLWAIGRSLVEQKYQRATNKGLLFHTQDRLLLELDDHDFKNAITSFIDMMPVEWKPLFNIGALASVNTEGQSPHQRAKTRLAALFQGLSRNQMSDILIRYHFFFGLTVEESKKLDEQSGV